MFGLLGICSNGIAEKKTPPQNVNNMEKWERCNRKIAFKWWQSNQMFRMHIDCSWTVIFGLAFSFVYYSCRRYFYSDKNMNLMEQMKFENRMKLKPWLSLVLITLRHSIPTDIHGGKFLLTFSLFIIMIALRPRAEKIWSQTDVHTLCINVFWALKVLHAIKPKQFHPQENN